MEVLILIAVAN